MPIELTAHTATGARLVSNAEELSERLAARAAEHDRDRTYPFEAIEALKAAGYFAAPIPVELGGLGVSSAHDLVVASSRLARGDASVAIGVNMHLACRAVPRLGLAWHRRVSRPDRPPWTRRAHQRRRPPAHAGGRQRH